MYIEKITRMEASPPVQEGSAMYRSIYTKAAIAATTLIALSGTFGAPMKWR